MVLILPQKQTEMLKLREGKETLLKNPLVHFLPLVKKEPKLSWSKNLESKMENVHRRKWIAPVHEVLRMKGIFLFLCKLSCQFLEMVKASCNIPDIHPSYFGAIKSQLR